MPTFMLYYDQGMTVERVGRELGTTSSAVFKFMRKEGLNRRTFQEANRKRFEDSPLSFQIKQNPIPEEKQLKIAGAMLYWGEGTKGGHNVDFANSNPDMIRIFLQFLREICGVDEKRLRIYLYCYADQNVKAIEEY